MKKLLFIIAIIALPLMVQGQWYGGVKIGGSIITDSVAPPKPVYDTIPVIMLVCDTTNVEFSSLAYSILDSCYHWVKPEHQRNGIVFWVRGYEVKKYSFYMDSYTRTAYLDSNKRRVKYLVWESKEVR